MFSAAFSHLIPTFRMQCADNTSAPPSFSVIMPVYNCRPWIREAVLSVLDQTEQSFELIVVDDCSTDGSGEAIADLVQREPRIRVIRRTSKGNAASARNTGLEAAKAAFIAFLDADDLWLPARLSSHLAVFQAHPETALVFSDFRGFGSDLGEEQPHLMCERDLPRIAAAHLEGPFELHGSSVQIYRCRKSLSAFIAVNYNLLFMHSITLSRKALVDQPRWFPTDLDVCEDLEFFLRILEKGVTIFLPETLAWYRRRPGSLTNREEEFFRGMIQFHSANLERCRLRLTPDEVRAYQARISSFRLSLGWQLRQRRALTESRRQYWLAFRMFPTWRGAMFFAKSFLVRRRNIQ
jgi:glycosyltransferase involved in cell wall biosynthesis